MILNHLFRKHSRYINNLLNPISNGSLLNTLARIPSVIFQLSEKKSSLARKTLSEKINSFCRKFKLLPYEYEGFQKAEDKEKWGTPFIDYLTNIMLTISKEHTLAIIDCLVNELKKFRSSFSRQLKISLFTFVMWYSAYLETRSKLNKMLHLAQRMGTIQFIILAVLYKTQFMNRWKRLLFTLV